MISAKVTSQTRQFFDRQAVMTRLTKRERSLMSKFGAYVRRSARSSIKPSRALRLSEMPAEQREQYKLAKQIAKQRGEPTPKKPRSFEPSKPGEAPRQGPRNLLRKGIQFAYEPSRHSVVTGPEKLPGKPDAPEDLEYGGRVKITQGPNYGETETVQPRPYMRPALQKNLSKVPALLRMSSG